MDVSTAQDDSRKRRDYLDMPISMNAVSSG